VILAPNGIAKILRFHKYFPYHPQQVVPPKLMALFDPMCLSGRHK